VSKNKKKTILIMHWLGKFYVNINKSAFVRKFEIRLLLSSNIHFWYVREFQLKSDLVYYHGSSICF